MAKTKGEGADFTKHCGLDDVTFSQSSNVLDARTKDALIGRICDQYSQALAVVRTSQDEQKPEA